MKKDKYIKYEKLKRTLKRTRLFGALLAIFVFIFILYGFAINLITGILILALSNAVLWWLYIDSMADKFEERIIDYEEIHDIKRKKK